MEKKQIQAIIGQLGGKGCYYHINEPLYCREEIVVYRYTPPSEEARLPEAACEL